MTVEEVIINNRKFIKTTPAEGYVLLKVGTDEKYAEAIDLPTSNFKYEEVEEPKQEEIPDAVVSNEPLIEEN